VLTSSAFGLTGRGGDGVGGTAAVAFLASDEARYITGVALPVDAGMLVR
jgi:NAD(P)-dependent dehydrogenase (short-subunit alcohol dehydrogenase family)